MTRATSGPAPIGVGIVDDDPGFAAALADLLRLGGRFCVIGIADGVTAGLELLADTRVELALVDVRMPDGGGVRVAESILRWPDRPTVALISAHEAPSAMRLKGAQFIRKQDIDEGRLLELIRSRPDP